MSKRETSSRYSECVCVCVCVCCCRKLYWGDPFELRIKMRDIDTSKVEFLPLQGVVVSLLTVDESTGTLYWYETNKKEVEMYYNGTRTTVASGSVTEFTGTA